eukprot:14207666-Ditylum_brightwellii.AAC.1
MTFIKNPDTGKFILASTANARQTRSKRQYLSPDLSKAARIWETCRRSHFHVRPGVLGSTNSYNVKLEK